jgi:hypothetical protein
MAAYLTPPYVDPELTAVGDSLRLFMLECEANADHRVTCNLDSIPNAPHHLRDAASAYFSEVELCPEERTGALGVVFAVGVKAASTPAPSP